MAKSISEEQRMNKINRDQLEVLEVKLREKDGDINLAKHSLHEVLD